jgi:hypothetical protein
VSKLSKLEAPKIMKARVDECDSVRKLDFEIRAKIYSIIKGNKGYNPISYSKLKEEYKDVYNLLKSDLILK